MRAERGCSCKRAVKKGLSEILEAFGEGRVFLQASGSQVQENNKHGGDERT